MDLRFYLSLFLRRLHWFVLVLVVCSGLGLALASILPTVYTAEARLLVESEQIPDQLAASTVQTQATEQVQIIQQRILTRDVLVEMANRLNIYADRRDSGKPPLDAGEVVEDLRQRIQINIGSGGPVRRGEAQATIVTVSFNAPTAALAAAVTNEVVTLILKEDVSMRTNVARQTLEFFEREVERLDSELSQRSAAILAFKEQNISSLPDSLDFRRNQQAAAQERLLQFERAEVELRDRRERLVRLFEAARAANDIAPDAGNRTPEQTQLQQLRDERSRILAVMSPENPKVKLLESQIAALESIVAEQVSGNATNAAGEPMSAYDIQLADIDGQLTYVADQKAQITVQIAELTKSIEATPGNAITLDTLERDYDAVQDQYNQAVANKAKAETGDMIEALAKGQRISVIEQALAPREPTSPNRPIIAAAGVGGGMVLGLGLVVLLELAKGGIRRPIDLTNGLGITPFATLPLMATRGEVIRRRLLVWGGLVVVLGGLAAAIWAVHTFYMPLDLLVEQLRRRLG